QGMAKLLCLMCLGISLALSLPVYEFTHRHHRQLGAFEHCDIDQFLDMDTDLYMTGLAQNKHSFCYKPTFLYRYRSNLEGSQRTSILQTKLAQAPIVLLASHG
ncbi:MAG: hypothetical protein NZ811_03535, partial [Gammaproteobacteria bacterium]|nr:hypothetical protein [Gammaproteobacteria bacterium]